MRSSEEIDVVEHRRAIRAAGAGALLHMNGGDPYQKWVDAYGSPFIETPHGTIIRPSLRGL